MALETKERPELAQERELTTLPHIFRARSKKSANRVALREKKFGVWREFTWAEYYARARAFGLGLVSLGLKPGDKLAIHSEDRPEWVIAELGTVCVGGTSVGIYPTNPAPEVQYLLSHSETRFLVAEDQEQVDKALAVADTCPNLERIIVIDSKGLRHYKDDRLMLFSTVEALGRKLHETQSDLFESFVDERTPDEIAMIVYTSGTTGPPKGAMLSERQVASAINRSDLLHMGNENDRVLSYLPLCHVAEKLFTINVPMSSGASANFAESIDTVTENLREVEPTVFLGVPRIWEKMAAGIMIRMQDASFLKRLNFRIWIAVGKKLARVYIEKKGSYGFLWGPVYFLGWLFLYRSIQRKLGLSKCVTALSGAAPIAPEILYFFHGVGIHIREAWGMTECAGGGTSTPPNDFRVGSVGVPLGDVEIRIADDGEILVRGPTVFAGYYRDPEATARTIDKEGWLHTGDVGYFDEHGHMYLTDRKKDIMITAGGKNVAPSEIENKLKTSPYIREAVVIGDKRKFISALIGIERDTVADWATRKGISFTTYRDLTQKPQVVDLIAEEVNRVNKDFAQVEQIKKFKLIPKELDHEDGEMTATQKVKRRVMEERFGDLVESMYKSA